MSIGVDICEIDRLRKIIEQHHERFINKIFTPEEIKYCQRKQDPAPSFAVRFAAKEALLKALGTGLRDGIRWRDMEVTNDPHGKPFLRVTGRAGELLKGRQVEVSLSHTGENAIAFVLLK
jgi:holo-[acyl-carrier protein] synthase